MRKNLKLFIVFVIVSMSFLSVKSFNAYAQEPVDISSMIPEGKTEEFYRTQAESIRQYNQLLDKFSSKNRSTSGKAVYDDCFGGAYLNDNGELVVLLTGNTYANRALVKEYTANPDTITKTCTYSYNELNRVVYTMNEHLEELREKGVKISSMYTDVMNNCVVIKVRGADRDAEAEIRKIVDSGCMIIQTTDEIIEYQDADSQAEIKGGYEIYNVDRGKVATLGFCAMRNGKKGYVTAGHFCPSIGQKVSYNGTVIGTVTQSGYYQNTYADAAFIESNGAANPTNMIMSYQCFSASTYEYPQNTSILMYGRSSGLVHGTIYSYNYTYVPLNPEEYTSTDHVLATYTSQRGDSGGPVFFYEGNYGGKSACTLLGIHSAKAYVLDTPGDKCPASFAKYGNIAAMLNVTAITE
ncbi:MAG: trypsin-like serine protease [Lachnospiraceae bacterium]|nr:trypsin-like serine protease [Lachnospiraceae bacterium]